MANPLRLSPMRASMPAKVPEQPPLMMQRALGGPHLAQPQFLKAGHNTTPPPKGNTKKSGTYKGKSNALGHGGRAQQLRDKGVPGGVIGAIARRKGAAPGMKNYHGK